MQVFCLPRSSFTIEYIQMILSSTEQERRKYFVIYYFII